MTDKLLIARVEQIESDEFFLITPEIRTAIQQGTLQSHNIFEGRDISPTLHIVDK